MSRYSWGADEHLFVEISEGMSLQANFKVMAIATVLRERRPAGLLDVCPANASYQVRFDPDLLAPGDLEALCRGVEEEVGDGEAVRRVYLMALSREPSPGELKKFKELMAEAAADRQPRREVFEDLFWAVLTGREFLFNR